MKSLDELRQDLLALKDEVLNCTNEVDVEDLYRIACNISGDAYDYWGDSLVDEFEEVHELLNEAMRDLRRRAK